MAIFVTSDHHFRHKNFYEKFKDHEGKPARPQKNFEEADEYMIDRWNKIVGPYDKVYHLGDFSITKTGISIAERLNGKKILILGNHDIFGAKEYLKYFKDVRAFKIHERLILSHIPVHERSLEYRFVMNVHGHVHLSDIPDDRYYNACVERTLWAPVSMDILLDSAQKLLGG